MVKRAYTFFPWKVNGLNIQPEDAVLLLSSISGAWTEGDGFVIGMDFRYWSKVSKFAMELLSKEHFIPGIVSNCSCPDSANPYKHIAAVYYILAEVFDSDPFMLFNLRGGLRWSSLFLFEKNVLLTPKFRLMAKIYCLMR